jgi:hypothetical protein
MVLIQATGVPLGREQFLELADNTNDVACDIGKPVDPGRREAFEAEPNVGGYAHIGQFGDPKIVFGGDSTYANEDIAMGAEANCSG